MAGSQASKDHPLLLGARRSCCTTIAQNAPSSAQFQAKASASSSVSNSPSSVFNSLSISNAMVSLRDFMLQTAMTFMVNMNSLDNPQNWINGRTANATHRLLPQSLNHPAVMNNTVTIQMLQTLLPGLHDFKVMQVGDDGPVIDEQKRMIMIHATGNGTTDLGPYANEYIFTLYTTDDGTQVRESWEFVDSVLAKEFEKKLDPTNP